MGPPARINPYTDGEGEGPPTSVAQRGAELVKIAEPLSFSFLFLFFFFSFFSRRLLSHLERNSGSLYPLPPPLVTSSSFLLVPSSYILNSL